MVDKLIKNNDIVFLIEHWLRPKEQFLINNLVDSHKINYQYGMQDSPQLSRGRPFGGKYWIIINNVKLAAFEVFNDLISMI